MSGINPRPAKMTRPEPGKWLGEVALNCAGSIKPPQIKQGKPHCPVCGQAFHWYEMVDKIQYVPEH